jgi:hypothetical protein
MLFPGIPVGTSGGIGGQLGLLRQPLFLAHLGLSVVLFAAMFSAYTYLGAWVEQALGLSAWGVAIALFLFGLAGLFGNGIAGRVADRAPIRVAVIVLIVSVNLAALAGGAILLAAAPLVLWSISHTASVTLGQVRVTLAGQAAASFTITLNISSRTRHRDRNGWRRPGDRRPRHRRDRHRASRLCDPRFAARQPHWPGRILSHRPPVSARRVTIICGGEGDAYQSHQEHRSRSRVIPGGLR